jgi:uroporphyrin-3 C-methyltransferase
VPALLIKIDELARMADDLPIANALSIAEPRVVPASGKTLAVVPAVNAGSTSKDGVSLPAIFDGRALQAWSQRIVDSLRDEAHRLLRVSRIDQPEAALLAPEQAFFLRENLKLRLLNARLGLLSRQTDSARTDLASASTWLGKYFDQASRKTHTAEQLLQQVQGQLKTSELPRLDDTMTALATAAAGR